MAVRFKNRAEAGRFLAEKLAEWAGRPEVVVCGLPRGGIPVAFEAALRLHSPLHAFLVRKLGVPGHEELAMGAVASGGIYYLNASVIRDLDIPARIVDEVVVRQRRELERMEQIFKIGRPPDLRDRVVILIDDGLATGATMRAAAMAARQQEPVRIIVAAPVGARDTCSGMTEEVDEVVCVQMPRRLDGVGKWYEDFTQTTDEEVRWLLEQGAKIRPGAPELKPLQEEL